MLIEEVPVKRAESVIKNAQVATPRSHDAQLSGAIVESICQAQLSVRWSPHCLLRDRLSTRSRHTGEAHRGNVPWAHMRGGCRHELNMQK